jgi:hypothetical protein
MRYLATLLAVLACAQGDEDVLVLNSKNFEDVLHTTDFMAVKFYA